LGCDLITENILKELHIIGTKYLTQLLNALLLKGYFPAQWEVVQYILILKPEKLPSELISYRTAYYQFYLKCLKKLFLLRLHRMVEDKGFI
jgi:hypothetical protein